MRFALYTIILSPHQLPLFKEMMARLGEAECRYVSVRPPARERTKMGWGDAFEEKWVIEEARKPEEAREVITTAKTLMSGMRDVGLFEERCRRGLTTIYCGERWFKPPIGMLRLLHPRYFKMARRFVKLLRENENMYAFPIGIHAARDMARLCGLMSGDLRCIFRAPELEFERRPGGRIWLAQRRRGAEKYCLDKMRMWGYFVENAGRMSCGSCTRRSEVVELRSALVRSGVATAPAPGQAAEFSLPCLDKATGCEQSHADACNPSLPHCAHSAPFLAPETGEVDNDTPTPANSCSLTHPTSSLQAPAGTDGVRAEDGYSPRVEAVYADVRFVKEDLATTVRYYSAKHWKPWMLQWGKMPPHPSVYIRREWFARLGGYKLGYDIAADYELLIRYLRKAGLKTRYIPGSVVRMRMGGKSTRGWRSNWRLNQEIVRGNRENGYRCCMAMLAPKYAFKIFEFILPRLGFNRKGA